MNFLSKTLWLLLSNALWIIVGIGIWVICFLVGRSISPLGQVVGVVLGAVLGFCASCYVWIKCEDLTDEQNKRREKLKAAELGKIITPEYVLNVINSTDTRIQKQHRWETHCKDKRIVWNILVSEVYESSISCSSEPLSNPHSISCSLAYPGIFQEKLLSLKQGEKVQVMGKIGGDLPYPGIVTFRLDDVTLV